MIYLIYPIYLLAGLAVGLIVIRAAKGPKKHICDDCEYLQMKQDGVYYCCCNGILEGHHKAPDYCKNHKPRSIYPKAPPRPCKVEKDYDMVDSVSIEDVVDNHSDVVSSYID